jgi:hypothetical protein
MSCWEEGLRLRQCHSSLIQALHSTFGVSCYSTVKDSLIRGAYPPSAHRTLVSHPPSGGRQRFTLGGEGHALRISRPDDLTKQVVSCSVAIERFDALDLNRVELFSCARLRRRFRLAMRQGRFQAGWMGIRSANDLQTRQSLL